MARRSTPTIAMPMTLHAGVINIGNVLHSLGKIVFTAWSEGSTKSWGLSVWYIMIIAACSDALVSCGSDVSKDAITGRHLSAQWCGQGRP